MMDDILTRSKKALVYAQHLPTINVYLCTVYVRMTTTVNHFSAKNCFSKNEWTFTEYILYRNIGENYEYSTYHTSVLFSVQDGLWIL